MYKKLWNGERNLKEISYDSNSEKLKQNYQVIFERVKSDAVSVAKYDENRYRDSTPRNIQDGKTRWVASTKWL